MAKYDGLIIPRSYNDYINKSSVIDVSQALQLTGVMDNAPAAQSTKPAKSGGIFAANAVIMASSATLTGVAISAGSVVRVLFTAALTGSDTTTGLTLTYNGNAYAVKVGKNGALAAFVASEISSGVFKYLQAYTTLELMFDGTQFIIIGNPVVLSSADYTIYADGLKNKLESGTATNASIVTSGQLYWIKKGNLVVCYANGLSGIENQWLEKDIVTNLPKSAIDRFYITFDGKRCLMVNDGNTAKLVKDNGWGGSFSFWSSFSYCASSI